MDKKKETELQRFIREMFVENVGFRYGLMVMLVLFVMTRFSWETLSDIRVLGLIALFTFGGYIANTK